GPRFTRWATASPSWASRCALGGSAGLAASRLGGWIADCYWQEAPMSLPHHNLVVWQRADELFIELHRLTHQRFPNFERFELGSQIRRAAFSVPANIVEGIARTHPKDSIRFFDVASASLSECAYGI